MLDLKKLERKLDEVLAKETRESLTSWLILKRSKAFLKVTENQTFISTTVITIYSVKLNPCIIVFKGDALNQPNMAA